MTDTHFLGEPFSYWIELKARARDLGVDHLIADLCEANAKVQYYELMLDRIAKYRACGITGTGGSDELI